MRQAVDPFKVPRIRGHDGQPLYQGRCCNNEVRILNDDSPALPLRPQRCSTIQHLGRYRQALAMLAEHLESSLLNGSLLLP